MLSRLGSRNCRLHVGTAGCGDNDNVNVGPLQDWRQLRVYIAAAAYSAGQCGGIRGITADQGDKFRGGKLSERSRVEACDQPTADNCESQHEWNDILVN